MQEMTWPPPYHVRRHRRARSVKLRAEQHKGLMITVPYRFSVRELPGILEENKDWIIKQLSRIHLQPSLVLPDSITFYSIQQTWKINYEPADHIFRMTTHAPNEIMLQGDQTDYQRCRKILLHWIKKQSKLHLTAELQRISQETQLHYNGLMIRGQKTVWGSCTSRKSISLNYKLFLLPAHLMRYVIIHELCHTKHLNHSTNFWSLVARFDPDYEQHRRELRQAERYIPAWI
jgi:predicted metal-dependent hydrolase